MALAGHVLFGQKLVVPGHGVIQLRPQMIRTGARHVAPLHSSFLAICAPCCCKPSGGKSFGTNVSDEDCSSAPRPGCALPHPEHEETNRVRKLIRSRSRNKNMTGVTRIYMNPNRIPEAGGVFSFGGFGGRCYLGATPLPGQSPTEAILEQKCVDS